MSFRINPNFPQIPMGSQDARLEWLTTSFGTTLESMDYKLDGLVLFRHFLERASQRNGIHQVALLAGHGHDERRVGKPMPRGFLRVVVAGFFGLAFLFDTMNEDQESREASYELL